MASLLPRIEELSGLPVRGPIRVETRTREELRSYIAMRLDERFPPGALRAMVRAYALLGLLPSGLDLRSLLLDLYSEQVVGYYDPPSATLYVMEGVPTTELRSVVAHELVHALQGQHADLEALLDPARGNDRQLAAAAAIEGHAMVVTLALEAEAAGAEPVDVRDLPDLRVALRPGALAERDAFPVFSSAPRYVREALLFPYIEGAGFVQEVWRTRPERPPPLGEYLPSSTQQVLDTAERFLHERAEPLALRLACAEGEARSRAWTVVYENELGQFETSLVLEERLGEGYGEIAREWAGDRYALLEDGAGGEVLVWYSAWRSEAAADAFGAALAGSLAGRGEAGFAERVTVAGHPVVRVVIAAGGAAVSGGEIPGVCVTE